MGYVWDLVLKGREGKKKQRKKDKEIITYHFLYLSFRGCTMSVKRVLLA